MVDLVPRVSVAGLQPAVIKRIGTAAGNKGFSDAARLVCGKWDCYRGLLNASQQLHAGKRRSKAAEKVAGRQFRAGLDKKQPK